MKKARIFTLDFIANAKNEPPVSIKLPMHHAVVLDVPSALNLISSSPNFFVAISEIRSALPMHLYRDFFRLLRKKRLVWEAVFSGMWSPKYANLRTKPPYPEIGIAREIAWATEYFVNASEAINLYSRHRTQFNEHLIAGEYEDCESIVKEITAHSGQSLWATKRLFFCLSQLGGLELQKKFLNNLKAECLPNGIAYYVAFCSSICNELTVSASHYLHIAKTRHEGLKITNDLSNYLAYYTVPGFTITNQLISDVLRWEASGSLVDYYETFLENCRYIIQQRTASLLPLVQNALIRLKSVVRDRQIQGILNSVDPQSLNIKNAYASPELADAAELLAAGEYERTWDICTRIHQKVHSPETLIIAAEAASLGNIQIKAGAALSTKLASYMRDVLEKNSDYELALAELVKFSLCGCSDFLAEGILYFADRQENCQLLPPAGELPIYMTTLNQLPLNPARFLSVSQSSDGFNTVFGKLVECEHSIVSKPILQSTLRYLLGKTDQLDNGSSTEHGISIQLYRAFLDSDYSRVIQLADMAMNSSFRAIYIQGVKAKGYALYKSGQVRECLQFITTIYLENQHLATILPIREFVLSLDKEARDSLRGEIFLSIIYDAFGKIFLTSDLDRFRIYACEDFLSSIGIDRPSKIRSCLSENSTITRIALVYFLRHVCVESVLDMTSVVYPLSSDVLEERLAVCRYLAEIDLSNAHIYQAEIKDLIHRIMIKRRTREIEQSKIYIDTENMRRVAKKKLLDTYNRYISFLSQESNRLPPQKLLEIDDALRDLSMGDGEKINSIVLPTSEMDDIFSTLVLRLRDEYVSNTEHGLDGYLSTRIRHGTLSSYLRRPLEESNLITLKSKATGEYQRNDYWLNRISSLSHSEVEQLNQALLQFAREFDQFFSIIVSDWIQVVKDSDGTGMFDFRFVPRGIKILSSRVTPDMDFDKFLDIIVESFGVVLDQSLGRIRDRLNSEAKFAIEQKLTNLQSEVERLGSADDIRELHNTILAVRTNMLVCLDRVSQWFKRAQRVANEPYKVKDAISISFNSVLTNSRAIELDLLIDDSLQEFELNGGLTSLVDILFIVFENIVRHSDVSPAIPKAHVHVQLSESSISFQIENQIGASVTADAIQNKIESIKEAIRDGKMMTVSKEGGTGFIKIVKILRHDFSIREPVLDFGLRCSSRFYLRFELPVRSATYESEE